MGGPISTLLYDIFLVLEEQNEGKLLPGKKEEEWSGVAPQKWSIKRGTQEEELLLL